MLFFPYSDENPLDSFPFVNIGLIAANCIVFMVVNSSPNAEEIFQNYGYVAADPVPWKIITSSFLHGSFFHLLGNMWFLLIFGDNVEDQLGHIFYLPFYFSCAIAGTLLHSAVVTSGAHLPMIGASDAISGVLGAYLVFFPWAKVNFFYLILCRGFVYTRGFAPFSGVVQIPAVFTIVFWFVLQAILAYLSLGEQASGGVAYFAHIGGFAIGLAMAGTLRMTGMMLVPRDTVLKSGPGYRKTLLGESDRDILPTTLEPYRDRIREAVKVEKKSLAQNRAEKSQQLLLRALDRNDQNEVVRRYSRFEQDFPTLSLPVMQQSQAARMLEEAGQDTLALEAYRKIVDQFLETPQWSNACFRTGRLYYAHKNYGRARQYLKVLLIQKPRAPESESARQLLHEVEQALSAIEAEVEQTGEESSRQTYLVIRQTADRLEAPKTAACIAAVTGEFPLDVRGRIVREQGILAEGLDRHKALAIAHGLQGIDVPVLVVPETQMVIYPPAESVRQAEIYDDRLVLRIGEKVRHEFSWDKIWLFNVSRVKITRTIESTLSPTFYPRMRANVRLASPSAGMGNANREEIHKSSVLDLFLTEPMVHLRLFEDKFHLEHGPDHLRNLARHQGFLFLVKELVRRAPSAYIGPGVDALLSEENLRDMTFDSVRQLDRYLFWLVQLYHFQPKAKE